VTQNTLRDELIRMTRPVKLRPYQIIKEGKIVTVEDPRLSASAKIAKRKSKKQKPVRRSV